MQQVVGNEEEMPKNISDFQFAAIASQFGVLIVVNSDRRSRRGIAFGQDIKSVHKVIAESECESCLQNGVEVDVLRIMLSYYGV